ncbi:MAG: hypothetical protein J5825_03750, partial [Lachnospiraceae bacterium]|nr:hypothetical protein [Lachnospiraceae bacterium]
MPKHHKKGTNTKIFITLLVVAGVLNLLTRVENTLFSSIMFTANFAIYVGMLLFWMQSLTTRLLPTRVRFYIRCTAFFMVFLLLCRVFRYRVVTNDIFLYRYMIYVYWIPQVMIPALFLMTSVRIGVGEAEGKKPIDALILVPAVCLCLLALTNDYHFLAYVPTGELELSNFKQGDYTYSFGFFLLNGWMILTALAGIIVLIRVTRKHPGRILPWILLILGVWITLEMILFFVISPYDLPRMYNSPELRVFGMLGIQEVCIRSRLIPHNDRHIEFFEKITLPVL